MQPAYRGDKGPDCYRTRRQTGVEAAEVIELITIEVSCGRRRAVNIKVRYRKAASRV
ncbi:hypothetical protein METY_0250 [Methylopila sp. Yamaguchi]|nr:hypothetical protein METY_0250 [Methylopila sp. Yamaguchi]